jgi:glycosyltransferase involved in cell wall biosynthesis
MKIVQINYGDVSGGAEKICMDLHTYLTNHQHQSTLYVAHKKSNLSTIIKLPPLPSIWDLRKGLNSYGGNFESIGKHLIGLLKTKILTEAGVESCYTPASNSLFSDLLNKTDIFHAHNLHGGFFDLNQLAVLSKQKPFVITLHDEWLFTGHCSYTLGCDRWLNGCGKCPHLNTYPAVKRDGTRARWHNKKKIFEKSKLYIGTPSTWLFERVRRSMIKPYEMRVIHNGIDPAIYYPDNQLQSRRETGLPDDAFILLYIANKGKNNPFRDYTTVE